MKRMEQSQESPGAGGRSASAAKEQNNCSVSTNPTLNPPPKSRSPLSTVAVQAVFHKSRSHLHSEKVCNQPLPPTERKLSVTTSSSFLNAAFTVCLPPSNAQVVDPPTPAAPVSVVNACPQGQALGAKAAQCSIAPQCQYENEDDCSDNQRSARDYELCVRSAPGGLIQLFSEAANSQSRLGKCLPADQTGGGRSSRIRRVNCSSGLGSEFRSCQSGPSGCLGQDPCLQQSPRTNYCYDGVPQPPPPPAMRTGVRCVKKAYKDPACDPDNPYILQFQDVTAAAFMIRNAITITPCVNSRLSRMCGMDVFLKKDFMQLTGSFKERGARYALLKLTPEQRATGIVAASLGNHALALACHGAQLAIPVTVVMPISAPLAKVSACRAYGVNVIIQGANLGESKQIALELADTKGLTYINGYDHPHIMAGQGTLGLELLEQVCDIDAIIIPVGGGGLLAGVATAAKTLYPNIKIIAVESEKCASFSAAVAAGKPVMVESQATIADGLAVPMVGVNAFASAAPLVDRTIVVNEDLISLSILRVAEVEKNVVEGAGATGIAAVLSGQLDEFKDKRVVILACGGNIDVAMLGRCLERGLVADGRLLSFTVFVEQNQTSLSNLFALLGRVGASIKDMVHDRKWDSENFFLFPVKIIVETPGASTSRELRTALSQMYTKICFHHNFEPITSHQPMYPDFPKVECGAGAENSSKRNSSFLAKGSASPCQREQAVRWPHGLENRPSPTNQRCELALRCRPECQEMRSCQRRESSPRGRSECASPSSLRCEISARGRTECQDADQQSESVARGRSQLQENKCYVRRESASRGRPECQDTDQRCELVARGPPDALSKGSCVLPLDQSLTSARCAPKESR